MTAAGTDVRPRLADAAPVTAPAHLAWSADGRISVEVSVPSVVSPVSVGDGDDVRTIGVLLRSVAVNGQEAAS